MKAKRVLYDDKEDRVVFTMSSAEALDLIELMRRIRYNYTSSDSDRMDLYADDLIIAERFQYTKSLLGFE